MSGTDGQYGTTEAPGLARILVRHYRADRMTAAGILAASPDAAAREAKFPAQAGAVHAGGTLPNLPEGRIEVWFQPLGDSLAGR
jgi:hypothetical protein